MAEDERKIIKNIAEAMKVMTEAEKEKLQAFGEGMAFMAAKRETEAKAG